MLRNAVRNALRPALRPAIGVGGLGSDLRAQVISALFGAGEQGVLIDPSDLSTLWKDTAGTDPVTADGDLVARVDDVSGNGNHLTQTDTPKAPKYRTDGTLHWLEFDGVDDFLMTPTGFPVTSASGYTAGAAAESVDATQVKSVLDTDGGVSGRVAQLLRFNASRYETIAFLSGGGNENDADGQSAMANNVPYVGVTVTDGSTDLEVFRNGLTDGATALPGAILAATNVIAVGARPNGAAQHLSGRVYAGAHVSEGISGASRGTLQDWLAEKSGVTLP